MVSEDKSSKDKRLSNKSEELVVSWKERRRYLRSAGPHSVAYKCRAQAAIGDLRLKKSVNVQTSNPICPTFWIVASITPSVLNVHDADN